MTRAWKENIRETITWLNWNNPINIIIYIYLHISDKISDSFKKKIKINKTDHIFFINSAFIICVFYYYYYKQHTYRYVCIYTVVYFDIIIFTKFCYNNSIFFFIYKNKKLKFCIYISIEKDRDEYRDKIN